MNAPMRGVILAVIGVILGIVVLGQGFGVSGPTLESSVETTGDDGGGDGSSEGDGAVVGADDGSAEEPVEDAGDDGNADDGNAGDDDGSTEEATPVPDDSGSDDSGPDILHPQAEVRVLVANAAGIAGLAGKTRDELVAESYNGITPTNVNVAVDESAVYYIPGYELDARNIARLLNAPPAAVAPMPDTPPVDSLDQAHVLVVIAADLAGDDS